jgi:hypothetical protein
MRRRCVFLNVEDSMRSRDSLGGVGDDNNNPASADGGAGHPERCHPMAPDIYLGSMPGLVSFYHSSARSVAVVFAPSIGVATALRALQGVAGAAGVVIASAVVSDIAGC